MSIKAMSWVWDSALPPSEKLIALAYADHADHEGKHIYPALDTIAAKTSMSRRNVIRVRQKLEERGVLIETRKATGRAPARYRMSQAALESIGRGDNLSPLQDARRDDNLSPHGVTTEHVGVTNPARRGDTVSPEPLTVHRTVNRTERGAARRTRATVEVPPALKNQPRPGTKRAAWVGPVEPDPAVAMYVALTQYEPTKLQADEIARTCTDLTLWETVIRARDGFGCSHRNVTAALNDYRAGGVRDYRAERGAVKSNGRPAAPAPAPTTPAVSERSLARIAEMQAAAAARRAAQEVTA